MGPFAALLLTLAVLSPGLGVFIVGNDMLHQAGSGAIICLLAAAGLGAAVAALYAELGSAFPHAGAEYTLAGRLLGPTGGFAMLAVYLVALPIGMAVSGLGIAESLHVSDVKPPAGSKFKVDGTATIAVVAIPEKEEVAKVAEVAAVGADGKPAPVAAADGKAAPAAAGKAAPAAAGKAAPDAAKGAKK